MTAAMSSHKLAVLDSPRLLLPASVQKCLQRIGIVRPLVDGHFTHDLRFDLETSCASRLLDAHCPA